MGGKPISRKERAMRATAGRTKGALCIGLGLATLTVVAVVMVPAVASAGDDAAAPAAPGHAMAGHDMAALEAAGLKDDLAQVRRVTARYHDLDAALAAGYELGWVNGSGQRIITGCVSHPTAGAMGYHYFNAELMADLTTAVSQPEVLVYAPGPEGQLRLVAVEWVVRGPNSNPPGVSEAPSVLGMPLHILVPAVGFWIMHAWVWQPNPAGMFADWNPEVTCP
jgi:hypothetical protein